jgi:hypothetical protein
MPCDQTRSIFGIDLGKIDRARLARALVEAGYSCGIKAPGEEDWRFAALTDTGAVSELYCYLPGGKLTVDAEGARVTARSELQVSTLTGRVRQVYSARTVAEISAKYRARATTTSDAQGVTVTVKVGR